MSFSLLEWCRRLWGTFRRGDSGTDEEFRFHLEMAEEDALRRGQSVREARLRAGGIAQAAEAVRDQSGFSWLADFLHDSRHGVRLLMKSRLFTTAAIVSLALGIGANTAIFSLIDVVMLRMLPVHEPERLVQFGRDVSYPLFRQFRDELRGFEDLFARSSMGRREVTFGGQPEVVNVELVSGNYHLVLGVSAIAGRTFDEEIDRHPNPVAMISHAFWKRRFAMDPAVIGRAVRLNRSVFTIIGITPPEFYGVVVGEAPDITLPLSLAGEILGDQAWLRNDSRNWLSVMGRLPGEESLERARSEVAAAYLRVLETEAQHYKNRESIRKEILARRMPLEPAGNGFNVLRQRFSEPLRLLMGIVALILLIACANLANLLLGRATVRRREIAVRLAIGAGRTRIIRQLAAEGILLAVAGGALGVLLAWWSANALVTMMSNGGNRIAVEVRPDLRVLAFAAAVSTAACFLFSLVPAIQASRQGIQPELAEARLGARWRLGRGLIGAQVAISVLLLIGAGLFWRTLLQLYSIETGFDRTDVVLFSVDSNRAGLHGHALQSRILQDLRSIPGIVSASFAMAPLSHRGWEASVRVEGYTHGPNEDDHAHLSFVAADYFKTLRIPLILGREFGERDTKASPKIAVVNETFAQRYFGEQSPIGKWVNIAGEPERLEIVGVTADVRPRSLRQEIPPTVYTPIVQRDNLPAGLYVARGVRAAPLIDTALKRIDARLRVVDLRTLEDDLSRSLLRERMLGTLAGFFAALSLLLVCVGIYGVMSFQVARRQKEIGIRMALGARPAQVTRMVLAETALPVGIGVGIGVAAALALTHIAEKMLFGVKPTDPISFAGACALLTVVSLIAAYVPSRLAARLSPVDTLRRD